jgi:uncharacterized protein (DUF1501 family)
VSAPLSSACCAGVSKVEPPVPRSESATDTAISSAMWTRDSADWSCSRRTSPASSWPDRRTVGHPALWFDTHSNNGAEQARLVPRAFGLIGQFLKLLKSETGAHGTLLDDTTILIGGEVGRFPRLNVTSGKDHWPENSWMLLGKGIRRVEGGVTLGATDDRLRGRPVDFRSGSLT